MPQGKIAPHRTTTAIRLTKIMKTELEYLAKQDGRSLNNYMERVLSIHVEQMRKEGKIPDNLPVDDLSNE